MDAKSLLKGTRLFHDFSPFELLKVEEIARRQFVARGDAIISEGDNFEADSSLYVISSGTVKAFVQHAEKELVLAILTARDVFGEVSFVDGLRRTAHVVALSDTELLMIDHDALLELLKSDNAIAAKFYRSLCRILAGKLRGTNKKVLEGLHMSG